MKCLIFGGSGQVGAAVVGELLGSHVCDSLTILGRGTIDELSGTAKVNQVVVDTGAEDFEATVSQIAQGHDVAIKQ